MDCVLNIRQDPMNNSTAVLQKNDVGYIHLKTDGASFSLKRTAVSPAVGHSLQTA